MKEKRFKQPMDVWLHNLKTIIELRMDPEGAWAQDLPKRMFPDDAAWFITHVQSMYMALCTPLDPSDEFILTDDSYNIYEGPNFFVNDKTSGKVQPGAHTPLHEFAPVSPKLMIILRSFLLPVPEEDAIPEIKEERELWHSIIVGNIYNWEVTSLLADLPIKKAQNNYSEVINGRVNPKEGEDGGRRMDHKFCFKYFPIHTEHVDTINGIFLQNAYVCSRVVFKTTSNFARTLEAYLTSPGNDITGDNMDVRRKFLKMLGVVSKSLGSEKESVWTETLNPEVQDYESTRLKRLEMNRLQSQMIKGDWGPEIDNEFMKTYKSLGGSKTTLLVDMEQSGLMWKLRVKIDSWSQGIDEAIRRRNRQLLIEIYIRLPRCRVWLFLKHERLAQLEHANYFGKKTDFEDWFQGPENIIARAAEFVKPERLTELMYRTTIHDIALKDAGGINVWAKIHKLDDHAMKQMELLVKLDICEPRSIRDCGIHEIEQLARNQKGLPDEVLGDSFLPREQTLELLTRIRVRSAFIKAFGGRLELSLLKALKKVFFTIVFPTPVQSSG